jgi:hypothetical protein
MNIQPVISQLENFISEYIAQISTKDAKQIETLNNMNKIIKSLEKIQKSLENSSHN